MRGSVTGWMFGLAIAALGCAGGGTQSGGSAAKLDRVQPCQASDGWCKANSTKAGFGAYFPGTVAESTTQPQPTPTGETVVVHVLASNSKAGTRFSLTCVEYVKGSPDPKKLLEGVSKAGRPEPVKRGGFDGSLIRYRKGKVEGELQAIAGPRFLCTQNVETTQGEALPPQRDIDRFFGSLVFGELAR